MKMGSAELETTNWQSTDDDLSAFTSHLRQHGVLFFMILFFSIIFLIAFFFFYFVCKYTGSGGFPAAPASSPTPAGTQAAVRSKGLDAESIKTLLAVAYVSLGVKEKSECSICLGLFEEVEMVKVMPQCFHVFHADCVDTWLSTRPSCPLCRASLDAISVRISA